MKRLLMTGACLVALSGPALGEQPIAPGPWLSQRVLVECHP